MSSFQREQLQQQNHPMLGGATRFREAEPSSGSRTITADPTESRAEPSEPIGVLQLRAARNSNPERRVIWSQDTIDNEGMGKKKSKICCIYHKPKAFDESSDESSSSSGSSSESESDDDDSSTASTSSLDNDRARPSKGKEKESKDNRSHGEDCPHNAKQHKHRRKQKSGSKTSTISETKTKPPKSNAYERGPSG